MGALDRLRDFAEDRLNVAVRPADQLNEFWSNYQALQNEAEDLALHAQAYFDGRPVELIFEKRHRLAQRARVAFLWDPIAGREAELMADFSLGNGVAIPRAKDPDVQGIIDDAWKDPKNEEVLTGFDAQRALSNDLRTQSNLFLACYLRNGRIRVTFLDADTIRDVVPDPEDEMRAIYYVGRRRVFRWDGENDRPDIRDTVQGEIQPRVTYYRHWRNLADAEKEREDNPELQLEPLPTIPEEKLDPGEALVYHVRVNRLGRQHFGTPFAARSLRFYSAMNQFTEARVSKALASTALIAKRVRRDGPRGILQAAGAVLNQTSELGQRQPPPGYPDPQHGGHQPPISPGAWWLGNQGDQIEPLNLSSGGAEAMNDAQIIRGALSAAGGWGQHYLGDASNANLATASTLELPQLMMVQAWQEVLEQLYRHFTDQAIEAALNEGLLGGTTSDMGHKPLAELRLSESRDLKEAERRTEKDLGYKFEMPYPGRRALPDVVNATDILLRVLSDTGIGISEAILEETLDFLLAQGFQLSNATEIVEHVIEEWKKQKAAAEKLARDIAAQGGQVGPDGQPLPQPPGGPSQGAPTDQQPADATAGYGAKMRTTPMQQAETIVPAALVPELAGFTADVQSLYGEFVTEPAIIAAKQMNGNPDPVDPDANGGSARSG